MRTAINKLGDTFATIETVNSGAGPFFNIRLEREGLPVMRDEQDWQILRNHVDEIDELIENINNA